MSAPVIVGNKIATSGDSVAAGGWVSVIGGLSDQMTYARKFASVGQGPPTTAARTASAVATGISPGINVSTTTPLTFATVGVPGATIAIMAAGYVATYITPLLPFNILNLMVGVNDMVGATDPVAFAAAYLAFLDRVHGDAPNARIMCFGILENGEQWLTGPNRFSSGLALTHPIEAAIAASAALRPAFCEYVSQCDWTLAYEVINNTPSPGANTGIMMTDSLHPNTIGQKLQATHAMDHFTFP